jgi:hypothetical protein
MSLDLHNRCNRTIYIFIAIGSGIGVFFVYVFSLTLFLPFLTGSKYVLSSLFAVLIEIPLIYRLYNGKIRKSG